MTKPVILIGGTAGAGKTTLARQLCHELGIDQRLSTGFIREVLRDQTSREKSPWLFEYTFRTSDPIGTLVQQAKLLERPLRVCIERARQEGTSLILEGNHLIPELYHSGDCDFYAVLAAPDLEEHRRRLSGGTHVHRSLGLDDIARARVIDEYLRREAAAHGAAYIEHPGEIIELLSKQKINGVRLR